MDNLQQRKRTMAKAALPPRSARDQVELITGSANAPIRIRAISQKSDKLRKPFEFEGPLSEIHERAHKLNLDDYNIYMVAQVTNDLPANGHFTRKADIAEVRCLYADGDDNKLPTEWHIEPTFTLVHPETKRWWAFWRVEDFPLDDLKDTIKRIAQEYDADPNICNPARIVRLAGYDRWKDGKNFGPYKWKGGTGEASTPEEHDSTLPAYEREPIKKGDGGDDYISEERLRSP